MKRGLSAGVELLLELRASCLTYVFGQRLANIHVRLAMFIHAACYVFTHYIRSVEFTEFKQLTILLYLIKRHRGWLITFYRSGRDFSQPKGRE